MNHVLMTVAQTLVLLGMLGQRSAMATGKKGEQDSSPHVLFVNVGKAVEPTQFQASVSNACIQAQVKWRTVSVPETTVEEVVVSREKQSAQWGKGAVLVVYLVNSPKLPGLLNLPGQCSLINIRALRTDNPSEQVYKVRLQRILMKGVGYAAGVGGNHDPRCVMYWKSFGIDGIDGTSSTFGPYAFFALQDILSAMGGEAIFNAEL